MWPTIGTVFVSDSDLVKVLTGGVIALTAAIIAGFSGIIVLIAAQL
jgi:uncharacterized membrane protein